MPTKKKKFNARFPPARIKKIMQTDEEVGKVAAAVPVIISKALEMFMQSLVEKACNYTQARNAKTLSTAHLFIEFSTDYVIVEVANISNGQEYITKSVDILLSLLQTLEKRCITSEQQFDFLKDLVDNIPDLPADEEEGNGEPKPKRKKTQPSTPREKPKPKKREKKKDKVKLAVSDESDEDIDSEEEESVSSGSHSNPGTVGFYTNNAISTTAVPTITLSKPDVHEQDEVFDTSPSTSLPMPSTFSHQPLLNTGVSIEEDDDYDS